MSSKIIVFKKLKLPVITDEPNKYQKSHARSQLIEPDVFLFIDLLSMSHAYSSIIINRSSKVTRKQY